ncbi:enoyl- hydratase isomerase [Lecanosticta acicola]|uniref:Enoyl- hydratase isomerase n=1 Tax=Lecanosticta acicola TaxID=111012 RepID=A0AAI8Z8L2_9PEZI|nr:enoyl- hydratase isomerase [Lecanosticta acicola]
MVVELEELLDDLHQEAETNDVRAVIIASSLNEVFCAGADLKERSQMDTESTQSFLSHIRRVFSSLTSLPIPTIACVSGYALGGGLELALCCNFRVFSSNAVVGLPETRLAIIPGAGGTFRLQQVVGACHALDMILTGRRVGSKEAGQMGLSTRTVEVGDGHADDAESLRRSTLDAGVSLAKEIASGGPLATKAALRAAAGACEDAENAAYSSVLRSEDRNRALESFSKRGTALELEFLGR